MNIITWNIRGLNNPRKQKILKNKLKMEKPDICFIQETKCTTKKLLQISRKSWNTYNFLDIDSQNSVGGILTLWNPKKVDLISAEATSYYLSVDLQVIGTPDKVMFTNVYGPQLLDDKKRMMTALENLRDRNMNSHWILAGDFNIIVTLAEKKGGVRRLDRDVEVFSAFIEKTNLVDIRTSNGIFTWNNKRSLHNQVASRLDRFLIS
jgi:exonuclease III